MRLGVFIAAGLLLVTLTPAVGCSPNPSTTETAVSRPLVVVPCGQQGFTLHAWGASEVAFFPKPDAAEAASAKVEGVIVDLNAASDRPRTVVATSLQNGTDRRHLFFLIDFEKSPARTSLLASLPAEEGDLAIVHISKDGNTVCLTLLSGDGRLKSLGVKSAAGDVLWSAQPDFNPIVQRMSVSSDLGRVLLQIEPSGTDGPSLAVGSADGKFNTHAVPDVAFSEMLPNGEGILLGTEDSAGQPMLQLIDYPGMDPIWSTETETLPSVAYMQGDRMLLLSWESQIDVASDGSQDSTVRTWIQALDTQGHQISQRDYQGSGPWLSALSPNGAAAIAWPTAPDNGELTMVELGSETGPSAVQRAVSGTFTSAGELIVLDSNGSPRRVKLQAP